MFLIKAFIFQQESASLIQAQTTAWTQIEVQICNIPSDKQIAKKNIQAKSLRHKIPDCYGIQPKLGANSEMSVVTEEKQKKKAHNEISEKL